MASYTVQRGDTLSSIASKSGMSWQQVFEANQGSISNPNLIYVGQQINIPDGSGSKQGNQVPDPSIYTFGSVDLSPGKIMELEDQAYGELEPYYSRVLAEAEGDVEIAKQRLQEDYERGLRLKAEDVAEAIRQAEDQAGFGQRSVKRDLSLANETLKFLDNIQFPLARQVLLETYNRRNIFRSGIRDTGEERLRASQALDRQRQVGAIDAIEQTGEEIATRLETVKRVEKRGEDRTKEQFDITKKRKTEDVDRELEREKHRLEQQRRLEAIGMAQSRLRRNVANTNISRLFGTG